MPSLIRKTTHALALAVAAPSLFAAAPAGKGPAVEPAARTIAPVAIAPMSTKERATLSNQFTTRWGAYVQRVYGVQADEWATRTAANLGGADASNLREAAQRDTIEGAMAVLTGRGPALSDDRAIDLLASGAAPKALGDLGRDLTYTPIAPCRVVDTRATALGAIAANSTRSFTVINSADFSAQGGSATNCGTLGLNATAVAVNVTAVFPQGAGYATAFPFGTTQPGTASINYATGAIVNNALTVQIPNPLTTSDVSLYSFAQSHYVIDIVGYYAPPLATALQCEPTSATVVNVNAAAFATAVAPACPATYTGADTVCSTSAPTIGLTAVGGGSCTASNAGGSAGTVSASRNCCRVPGR